MPHLYRCRLHVVLCSHYVHFKFRLYAPQKKGIVGKFAHYLAECSKHQWSTKLNRLLNVLCYIKNETVKYWKYTVKYRKKSARHGFHTNEKKIAWFISHNFLSRSLTFNELRPVARPPSSCYLNGLILTKRRYWNEIEAAARVLGCFLVTVSGFEFSLLGNSLPTNPQSSFALVLLHSQSIAAKGKIIQMISAGHCFVFCSGYIELKQPKLTLHLSRCPGHASRAHIDMQMAKPQPNIWSIRFLYGHNSHVLLVAASPIASLLRWQSSLDGCIR